MISRPTCPAIPAAPWSRSTARIGRCAPGVFEVPNAPNSDVLVINGKNFGSVVELEERYAPFDQPGKLRIGLFANDGNTANYRQALAHRGADPALDINAVVTGIRQDNLKYGFYLNAEQQIVKDIGLFARAELE